MIKLTNKRVPIVVEFTASFAVFGLLVIINYLVFIFLHTVFHIQKADLSELSEVIEEESYQGVLEGSATGEKSDLEEVADMNLVPSRILAPSIGLDTHIIIPNSTDISELDRALLDGVVYYPGSGYLGEDSNIFLFGHSSFLPVVRNQNFRVFNQIKDLEVSEVIILETGERSFQYRVISKELVKDHEVRVNFATDRPMLTLVTCNSFGAKEDRYIVEAVLVN